MQSIEELVSLLQRSGAMVDNTVTTFASRDELTPFDTCFIELDTEQWYAVLDGLGECIAARLAHFALMISI